MRQIALHTLVLIAVASTIFFISLGKARLWDRDEPRNAGCAVEMMQRGDLIVPIFNDELRQQKPVFLYWLMISAYSLFGVNEFAARFWSALLALGTVILTYAIGRRLFSSSVALLAGIVLCTSLMFCVAARAATPDSALIYFSTLGLYFYVVGTFARRVDLHSAPPLLHAGHWFPQDTRFVILMNVAFGLAVLTKGPVGAVLPTAIIGMFLLIQRLPPLSDEFVNSQGRISCWLISVARTFHPIHFARTCWYMRPLTAIVVILIVAAPWYLTVGLKTDGDFTRLFFLNENLARATSTMENHGGAWWYYPIAIAIGFFPWSIFLAPVAIAADQQLTKQTTDNAPISLLVCWVAVQVGLFSLAETKLPSYVTPCYPALAVLTAYCLLHWLPNMQSSRKIWQYGAYSTFVGGGLITTAGLAIASNLYFPNIWWITLIGLVPIIGGTIAMMLLYRNKNEWALRAMCLSAMLFCFLFFGIGTVAVDSTRQTQLVLDEIQRTDAEQVVASYHCLESSWVYYTEKPIYELQRGPATDDSVRSLERENYWQKKPQVSPEDFVKLHPDAMIMTTDEHLHELLSRLPRDFEIVRQTDFFLKQDRKLVLVQRSGDTTATANNRESRSVR